MGHNKISDEKPESVDSKSVYDDHRGVKYLCRTVYENCQAQKNRDICSFAQLIESVLLDLPDKEQKHAENPEHLDIP